MPSFDLRTQEGIEAAERDLAAFERSVADCATRDILPWDMIAGRRGMILAEAKQRLKAEDARLKEDGVERG